MDALGNIRKLTQALSMGAIAMLSSGCIGRPQQIEERAGRWFVTGLTEGSSKYSFAPLDSSWEPNPPPTDNCALFYGKKEQGTHIGVFFHPLKPGVEPERILNDLPKDMMSAYLTSNENEHRAVLISPRPFGNGVYAAAENRFTMAGAKVRAFEAFVIVPCSRYLVGFTFKRRIEVDSWDFRAEQGEAVIENELKTEPEHEEFLAFVRGASFWDAEKTIRY
jgi:hypothetical protein